VDDYFCFKAACSITETADPNTIKQAMSRPDWPEWKQAIESEHNSLNKRKVFGRIQELPFGKTLVGFRYVLTRKRNDKGIVTRYKARLVAQGFSQVFGLDFSQTYSPVMDSTTFRFLISFATMECLRMTMMDVVTAYLYGDLDAEIYMKVPDSMVGTSNLSQPCIQLLKSLYGLKQAGRMWFHRLAAFLIANGFINNDTCPCVFIKREGKELAIIAVYVDDLNIIGTTKACEDAENVLCQEFEMKKLGHTSLCIGIQLAYFPGGVLVHQSQYTKTLLERFNMIDCNSSDTPMIVRSLEASKDQLGPIRSGEELLSSDYPYLSAIGALTYLANTSRPDISFAVNLLARFSQSPTMRHWKGISQVLRYLKGTIDAGLFYSKSETDNNSLVGYADAGYLSDPHSARSQSGYVFMWNGTPISWKSTKQTIVATSTNHSEIIALHEASRECIWLRSLISNIREPSGYSSITEPTIIYEDNAACIDQIKSGFIKGDRTKHISPKFFFTSALQGKEINVTQISSANNVADIFTKSLGKNKHWELVPKLGLRRLSSLESNSSKL
jgi:hypothetical protein